MRTPKRSKVLRTCMGCILLVCYIETMKGIPYFRSMPKDYPLAMIRRVELIVLTLE